jgi:hypothetical protein
VWRAEDNVEYVQLSKKGGLETKIEHISSQTETIPWAVADSTGLVSVHHSMPQPPLETILQKRRALLSQREVDRLSKYEHKAVAVKMRGSGPHRPQEVRTATAVARQITDSILTAGTLLTLIGSVRYDKAHGFTMYAAGDLSYIGSQDLQTLVANARSAADSANWIAKAGATVGGIALGVSILWRVMGWDRKPHLPGNVNSSPQDGAIARSTPTSGCSPKTSSGK